MANPSANPHIAAQSDLGNMKMEEGTRNERPPDYSEERPPSYGSMLGKVRHMKETSTGNVDFTKKMMTMVIWGTVSSAVMIAVLLALPMAQIVIGSLYFNECPRERYIPIYLVVAGAFGLLKALLQITQQICKKCSDSDDMQNESAGVKRLRIFDGPFSCFLMAWFIAGAVWTYRIHGDYQSDTPGAVDYCQKTVYLFSFWSITGTFIVMAVSLLCCCIGSMVVCCCMKK